MPEAREQEIVEGLRSGNVQAWHALYETHVERVWHDVSRRLGAGSGEVADVVQEVFLDAARGARNYRRDSGTLSQWLNGIVRRKIALYWRGNQRRARIADDEVDRLIRWLDGDTNDPLSILESAELVDSVRMTLSQLPDDYAQVLRAKYAAGRTARQIAAEMQTTVEAVQSKLKRARQQFREKFARDYQTPQPTSCGSQGN